MEKSMEILNPQSTDFCMLEYDCAYLPSKKVRMHYRYIKEASLLFTTSVIQRGWRRFGNYFFYPICKDCNGCKNLRIDVRHFTPSRSQKRTVKRNRDTQIVIQKPTLTSHHIRLYNLYHEWKPERDGWKHREINQREYYENFVEGAHDFGKEVLYIRDNRLIGIDLIDIVADGISAVYFFHDPAYARFSPGIYSLLYQIELARSLGLDYIYLGYWVEGCRAFAYKQRFQPYEILEGFPHLDEKPLWKSGI
jgi:arginine-tRNA-protein transferase